MLQRLGRFEILQRLGQGAMGDVFLGLDPAIGRQVALKTIRPDVAQGEEARERFAREARAAGGLSHPNLVTVHEFGEDQGTLYLAMEYVPGVDLEAMLRDRVVRPVEALDILAQVCDGLAFAHQKGVLHRDIKPSNIRVRREGEQLFAKVMDFGIARLSNSDMTGTGTLLGTFGYMAPEYIKHGTPDARSDLFAVGVILYEALSGHRPFEGDTTATVLFRVVNEEPAPLDPALLKGISPAVTHLLAKALAKEPHQRFQSAADLARALRAAQDPGWSGLPGSQPTRRMARPGSGPRRMRGLGIAFAGLLALAAAAGGWTWFQRSREAPVISLPAPEPRRPAATAPPPAAEPAPRPQPAPRREAAVPAPPPMDEVEATGLLNEAARGLLDQPLGSLGLCDRVLRAQPENARAYALKAVALYGAGQYEALPGVLEAAQAHGIEAAQLEAYGAFKALLRAERRDRRLPPEVRTSFLDAFGDGGRPPLRPWRRRP